MVRRAPAHVRSAIGSGLELEVALVLGVLGDRVGRGLDLARLGREVLRLGRVALGRLGLLHVVDQHLPVSLDLGRRLVLDLLQLVAVGIAAARACCQPAQADRQDCRDRRYLAHQWTPSVLAGDPSGPLFGRSACRTQRVSPRVAGRDQEPRTERNPSAARCVASRSAVASGPAPRISRDIAGTTFRRASPNTPRRLSAVAPWAPRPGASSGPLIARSSSVLPMVAPTTAPNEPSSSPAFSFARAASTAPATVVPSAVRADWNCGASGLEVSAITNRPLPDATAWSMAGCREPNPR